MLLLQEEVPTIDVRYVFIPAGRRAATQPQPRHTARQSCHSGEISLCGARSRDRVLQHRVVFLYVMLTQFLPSVVGFPDQFDSPQVSGSLGLSTFWSSLPGVFRERSRNFIRGNSGFFSLSSGIFRNFVCVLFFPHFRSQFRTFCLDI